MFVRPVFRWDLPRILRVRIGAIMMRTFGILPGRSFPAIQACTNISVGVHLPGRQELQVSDSLGGELPGSFENVAEQLRRSGNPSWCGKSSPALFFELADLFPQSSVLEPSVELSGEKPGEPSHDEDP